MNEFLVVSALNCLLHVKHVILPLATHYSCLILFCFSKTVLRCEFKIFTWWLKCATETEINTKSDFFDSLFCERIQRSISRIDENFVYEEFSCKLCVLCKVCVNVFDLKASTKFLCRWQFNDFKANSLISFYLLFQVSFDSFISCTRTIEAYVNERLSITWTLNWHRLLLLASSYAMDLFIFLFLFLLLLLLWFLISSTFGHLLIGTKKEREEVSTFIDKPPKNGF